MCKYPFSNFLAHTHISKMGPAPWINTHSLHTPTWIQTLPQLHSQVPICTSCFYVHAHKPFLWHAPEQTQVNTHTHTNISRNIVFPSLEHQPSLQLCWLAQQQESRREIPPLGHGFMDPKNLKENLGSERYEIQEAGGYWSLTSQFE